MSTTLHLVLIEDEIKSLNLLIKLLDHVEDVTIDASFTVPGEGLQYLYENQPDLLLLDIRMPGITGLDLVEALRKKRIFVPVIFISAYDEFILDALRQKAADYILKPVSLEALRKTIHGFREDEKRRNGMLDQFYHAI